MKGVQTVVLLAQHAAVSQGEGELETALPEAAAAACWVLLGRVVAQVRACKSTQTCSTEKCAQLEIWQYCSFAKIVCISSSVLEGLLGKRNDFRRRLLARQNRRLHAYDVDAHATWYLKVDSGINSTMYYSSCDGHTASKWEQQSLAILSNDKRKSHLDTRI